MVIQSLNGFVYLNKQLFCVPGTNAFKARILDAAQGTIEIYVMQEGLETSDDIQWVATRYTAVEIEGETFDTAAAAVTALNTVLQDTKLSLNDLNLSVPTSTTGLVTGDVYSSSLTLKLKS